MTGSGVQQTRERSQTRGDTGVEQAVEVGKNHVDGTCLAAGANGPKERDSSRTGSGHHCGETVEGRSTVNPGRVEHKTSSGVARCSGQNERAEFAAKAMKAASAAEGPRFRHRRGTPSGNPRRSRPVTVEGHGGIGEVQTTRYRWR